MKTTRLHFAIFKEECLQWIDSFGLKDWHVEFLHEDWGNTRGNCKWDGIGMIASLNLNPNWEDTIVTNRAVKRCAFHEVCHLLFGKIHIIANKRYSVTESMIDAEIHSIIRRLENVLIGACRKQTGVDHRRPAGGGKDGL